MLILPRFFTEEHPLAEVSMPIDAPNSMEPMTDLAFFENREDTYRTPRGKKKGKCHFKHHLQ